jgi:hypothetical protein
MSPPRIFSLVKNNHIPYSIKFGFELGLSFLRTGFELSRKAVKERVKIVRIKRPKAKESHPGQRVALCKL